MLFERQRRLLTLLEAVGEPVSHTEAEQHETSGRTGRRVRLHDQMAGRARQESGSFLRL
jgi:hypothetical protein